MKTISIVTPCFNEEENVNELYERIKNVMAGFDYNYEHIFIDNASTDRTTELLRGLGVRDKRVKVIVNTRNFGHIRSPYYGLLQAQGNAVVILASDLQDPPERISDFIQKWEEGYKIVIGVKTQSQEAGLFYFLRTMFYRGLRKLSNVELIEHFTGFGLYDQQVIEILRSLNDPYPYFRGLIAEIGFPIARLNLYSHAASGVSPRTIFTHYMTWLCLALRATQKFLCDLPL